MAKVKFQVGDRVVLLVDHPDNNNYLVAGCTGTVCKVFTSIPDTFGVDWDDDIEGHSCDGTCNDRHGWNVDVGDIERLVVRDITDEDLADMPDVRSLFSVSV